MHGPRYSAGTAIPPYSHPATDAVAALFARARATHSAGRLQEAEALYRQILDADPEHADSRYFLGIVGRQTGGNEIAEARKDRPIALNSGPPDDHGHLGALMPRPDLADAHAHLGDAHKNRSEWVDAVACYRRAIAIKPDFLDAHINLSRALREQGCPDQAVASARRALAIKPSSMLARFHLSAALEDLALRADVLVSLREAVRRHPESASAHFNLGMAANEAGRFDEAAEAYEKAITLDPGLFRAHNNLGLARMAKGQRTAAIEGYRRALAIQPAFAEAHNNLGVAFREEGRVGDAEASFREATRLEPGFAEAHGALGMALYELGRLDEAVAALLEALRLKAQAPIEAGSGDGAFEALRRIPELKADSAEALSRLLSALHYDARISNRDLIAAMRRYGELSKELRPAVTYANDRAPSRRLRVGYVCADFSRPAIGFFLFSVLEAHDKAGFETFCYDAGAKMDASSLRLRAAADQWREIVGRTDEAVARMIREDAIDILIDLSGHAPKNRLSLFALRPAPVQASWLGDCAAIASNATDYLLTDGFAVPSGEERSYPEAIVRLPRGRFCYAPPEYAPPPVDPPSLKRGFVTFGSFNHVAKIGDGVVALWAETLRANPSSRLVLKWRTLAERGVRSRLAAGFLEHGVSPDRLDLRGGSPHRAMLEQYGEIDVALDPFPVGGGLTSCEALWMGVPVVTLPGDRPASRQTAGILDNLGLGECIATSPADYVARATALAADPRRLVDWRRSLRGTMAASPLSDAPRFARALEMAYAEIWRRWRSDQAPKGFSVVEDGAG